MSQKVSPFVPPFLFFFLGEREKTGMSETSYRRWNIVINHIIIYSWKIRCYNPPSHNILKRFCKLQIMIWLLKIIIAFIYFFTYVLERISFQSHLKPLKNKTQINIYQEQLFLWFSVGELVPFFTGSQLLLLLKRPLAAPF